MRAFLQLVSAPLNPIPIAEHFRRSHPRLCSWSVPLYYDSGHIKLQGHRNQGFNYFVKYIATG